MNLSMVPSHQPSKESKAALQKAINLAGRGEKRKAVELCQNILKHEKMQGEIALFAAQLIVKTLPQSATGYFYYGAVLHYSNKYYEAQKAFERAIALDPDNPLFHYHYSSLLIDMLEVKKSMEHIDICLSKDPENKDYLLAKARLHVDAQEFEEADKLVVYIMEKWNEENHHILTFRGNILAQKKDNNGALKSYLDAHRLKPEDVRLIYNIGNVYSRLGNQDKAYEYWKKMVLQHADNVQNGLFSSKADSRLMHSIYTVLSTFDDDNNMPNCKDYLCADLDKLYGFHKLYEHDEGAILEMDNITSFSDEWLLINNNQIYCNFIFHLAKSNRSLKTFAPNGKALIEHIKPVKRYDNSVILLGGADNYYHWICDYLPRLSLIEACTSLKNLPILVNEKWMQYQQQSLELIGFDMSRIQRVPVDHELHFEQLYLPHLYNRPLNDFHQSDWYRPMLTLKSVNWLRDAYREYIKPQQKKKRRIFVARKSSMRMCMNEEAVYDIAREYGFEYIDNAGLDFKDQIELYASAETVMGVHGAGFTNMVFAPRDAKLIELYPKNNLPEFYAHMTSIIGQEHHAIEGRIVSKVENMVPSTWNFEVDLDAVRRKLDEVLVAS